MGVNISAKFKKDDRPLNGLEAIKKDLIDTPYDEHYIIAKITTLRVTEDIEDGGTKTPTIKLKHIEVMLNRKDEADCKKIFDRAAKARLGEVPQQTLFENQADNGSVDGEQGDGEQGEGEPDDEAGDAPAGSGPEFSG